jgi:twitching motility protein PilT
MNALRSTIKELLLTKGTTDIDVSLIAGLWMRRDGDLVRAEQAVAANDFFDLIGERFQGQDAMEVLKRQGGQDDFGMSLDGIRLRAHLYFSQSKPTLSLRRLQDKIPDLGNLGLPESVNRILKLKQGLVLVTGPTGSGKTTTLASILNTINASYPYKIVTLEAPIEYLFQDQLSTIRQRLIDPGGGGDCMSFGQGVEAAMREDPDIILVGEMRDYETVSSALTAAQTGHLVLGTLHTNSGAETIGRILSTFPEAERGLAKSVLASVFRCVLAQRLLKSTREGMVLAAEIIHTTSSIRTHILKDNTHWIDQDVRNGLQDGQIGMNRSLLNLYNEGCITRELAIATSTDPSELEDMI